MSARKGSRTFGIRELRMQGSRTNPRRKFFYRGVYNTCGVGDPPNPLTPRRGGRMVFLLHYLSKLGVETHPPPDIGWPRQGQLRRNYIGQCKGTPTKAITPRRNLPCKNNMPTNSKAKKTAKTEKAPTTAGAVVKEAAVKVLASTERVLTRVVGALASLAGLQDSAKSAAEKAKVTITEKIDSVKVDWKAVASEHKDKAERKALAARIHKALQADHGLSSQRASEMLKVLGLDGLLFAKHQKVRVELPDGIVEMLFTFADEKLGADGEKVKTALSRAYGKARDVYRKG